MRRLFEGFFNGAKKVSSKITQKMPEECIIGNSADVLDAWHVTENDIIILFNMDGKHYLMLCLLADEFTETEFWVYQINDSDEFVCNSFELDCIRESCVLQNKIAEMSAINGNPLLKNHTMDEFEKVYKNRIYTALDKITEELGWLASSYYEIHIKAKNKDWMGDEVDVVGPFHNLDISDLVILVTEKRINDVFNSNIRL